MTNWAARVRALENTARFGRPAPWAGDSDMGEVAPHVMPALCSLAARLGYPVSLAASADMPRGGALGFTHPGPEAERRMIEIARELLPGVAPGSLSLTRGIYLLDSMSPASTARVLGHEMGHALAEPGRDLRYTVYRRLFTGEDSTEELGCELGTGAFCAAHGIGTGAFCRHYVGGRLQGAHAPEASIRQAARLAAALHEAVTG